MGGGDMSFTVDDFYDMVNLYDDINDLAREVKKLVSPYHYFVGKDGERYYSRFDTINDRNLLIAWRDLCLSVFSMVDLDEKDKYKNWSDYALEVHDLFVIHCKPHDVWVVTAESIVYDKLPKFLREVYSKIKDSEHNLQNGLL